MQEIPTAGTLHDMYASPARRPSGTSVVYDLIRAQIIDGSLEPMARLSEPELARGLGVSRTPVRESLRLLSAEGLVQQKMTGKMRVTPLQCADLGRIYEVRDRLEGLLARDACIRLTADGRNELAQLLELMERTRDSNSTFLSFGREFHAKITEHADNPWCAHLLHQIRGHVDRYRAQSTSRPGRMNEATAEHRVIMDAFNNGDPDTAEQAMRRHIQLSARSTARALRTDDPVPEPEP